MLRRRWWSVVRPLSVSYTHLDVYKRQALARLREWYEVYRQRRALLGLDDAMLKDIGTSRADALREGNKPFWQP